ncbi:MAG: hypothetical protein LBR80_18050, partial [Deltaproteobacteria bacterium]|nr:hypothetical protein [Deltaproteobacteria bacterium]
MTWIGEHFFSFMYSAASIAEQTRNLKMSRSSAVDWNSRMKRAVARPVQAVGTPYPHAESGQFR